MECGEWGKEWGGEVRSGGKDGERGSSKMLRSANLQFLKVLMIEISLISNFPTKIFYWNFRVKLKLEKGLLIAY